MSERIITAHTLIRMGFLTQLILLGLVDWGTIAALSSKGGPWYHVAGLVTLNAILLSASVFMWKWLVRQGDA